MMDLSDIRHELPLPLFCAPARRAGCARERSLQCEMFLLHVCRCAFSFKKALSANAGVIAALPAEK